MNLKVIQTLGNDKVQVGLRFFFWWFFLFFKCYISYHLPHGNVCASQYGVPVIKYDRRGFKPRPRQLLLTNTFAVLVDRTKIKQRIDYAALRGEGIRRLGEIQSCSLIHDQCWVILLVFLWKKTFTGDSFQLKPVLLPQILSSASFYWN